MKILIIHNHFRERGGEDQVVESEIKMLKEYGHEIIYYERSNREIDQLPLFKKIIFSIKDIIWSDAVYKEMKEIIKKNKPDIAHIHNIFVKITPSVYYAIKEEGVPIVQTLHSYRFICPRGVLYHKGKRCTKCVKWGLLFAVINKCWNGFFLTWCFVRMLSKHYKQRTFYKTIDGYIALSEFSRNVFIQKGFPAKKIFVKPNFVNLNLAKRETYQDFALFIGRLADYKGVITLLEAFREVNYSLKIIGAGPLYNRLKKQTQIMHNVELLGVLPSDITIKYIRKSSFVVFPTECYESTPRVIIESFACGTPVIASNIGGITSLVKDNINGLLFEPNNSADLIKKINLLYKDKDLIEFLGDNAYRDYKTQFAMKNNYDMLINIYNEAVKANT